MRTAALMLEIRKIESEINSLYFENALFEVMQNEIISRLIINEQRKVARYALRIGVADKRRLDEGMMADIALGLGQAVGSLPGLGQLGVGAAFGVAGVLWYGNEMLKSSGFDFAMNLLFCLFSAAAIEPTGVFGGSGAIAKLATPFIKLGEWARGLGKLTVDAARAAYNGLSGPTRAVVNGALRAEGPLRTGMNWVTKNIVPRVQQIFEAIKTQVMKLPGSGNFAKIVERVTQGAGSAVKMVTEGIEALINFAKTALGKTAATAAEAEAKTAASAVSGAETAWKAAATSRRAALARMESTVTEMMAKAPSLQQWAASKGLSAKQVVTKIMQRDPEAIKQFLRVPASNKLAGDRQFVQSLSMNLNSQLKTLQKTTGDTARTFFATRNAELASRAARKAAYDASQVAAARTADATKAGVRGAASVVKNQ